MLVLSFISLFLNDLFLLWFILEVINFLFIILINFSLHNKKIIFFYFIVQLISSLFLIFSITLSFLPHLYALSSNIIFLSLLLKLGVPPFHLWIPTLSIHLSWLVFFILLTIQKLTPFYIINLISRPHIILMILILIITSIIPPFIMIKTTNFKILLTYSSINQSGWLMLMTFIKSILWLIYFIFYRLILRIIIFMIYKFKISLIFNYKRKFISENFIHIIYILNLAGLPPFSLFFIKWYRIFFIIWQSKIFFILIVIIFRSLIILYIYTNIILNSLFIYKTINKFLIFNPNINNYFTILYLIIFITISVIIIFS